MRFAEDFEHASEIVGSVVGDEKGAARGLGERRTLGKQAYVFAGDFQLSDMGYVKQLRERRVKIRIATNLFLVSERVGKGDCAVGGSHDQSILSVNLIESSHGRMTRISDFGNKNVLNS